MKELLQRLSYWQTEPVISGSSKVYFNANHVKCSRTLRQHKTQECIEVQQMHIVSSATEGWLGNILKVP